MPPTDQKVQNLSYPQLQYDKKGKPLKYVDLHTQEATQNVILSHTVFMKLQESSRNLIFVSSQIAQKSLTKCSFLFHK